MTKSGHLNSQQFKKFKTMYFVTTVGQLGQLGNAGDKDGFRDYYDADT